MAGGAMKAKMLPHSLGASNVEESYMQRFTGDRFYNKELSRVQVITEATRKGFHLSTHST